jgi:hypothetical protein
LFILHARATTVFDRASMHTASEQHRTSAQRCLNAFIELQTELKSSIEPMVARIQSLEEEKSPA